MERKDGFIDLNAILNLPETLRIVSRSEKDLKWMGPLAIEGDIAQLNVYLSSRKDVKVVKSFGSDSLIIKFIHEDGNIYYFNFDNDCTPYGDLIYGCICDELGISHIDYDVARLGFLRGTLSRDFKKKGVRYISGEEIIRENGGINLEFSPREKDEVKVFGENAVLTEKTKGYNSFEGIWFALENRYKNNPSVVEKLMRKLVDMFIVDILTGQSDRHSENWMLIEKDGEVDMHSIFDSRRIFSHLPCGNVRRKSA